MTAIAAVLPAATVIVIESALAVVSSPVTNALGVKFWPSTLVSRELVEPAVGPREAFVDGPGNGDVSVGRDEVGAVDVVKIP
jgi:hypothetical protein